MLNEDIERPMVRGATISFDGLYRTLLTRSWSTGPIATFVMLNPSTADGRADDPTIRRCIGFAKREGCGSLNVVNLYAWRATKPKDLLTASLKGYEITGGSKADEMIVHALDISTRTGGVRVAAWGAGLPGLTVQTKSRVAAVCDKAGPLQCFGVTVQGHPRHPLYLAGGTPLVEWSPEVVK